MERHSSTRARVIVRKNKGSAKDTTVLASVPLLLTVVISRTSFSLIRTVKIFDKEGDKGKRRNGGMKRKRGSKRSIQVQRSRRVTVHEVYATYFLPK